jgi:deoxyribose-phosphate aldolase
MDPDRRLLITCLDLTALGDTEDDASVGVLCARARRPVSDDPTLQAAAVCVWPRFLSVARAMLGGSAVRVATATGGFPDPPDALAPRLAEIEWAVEAGADEVDVVVQRRLLAEPDLLAEELGATRVAATGVTWKAILETGALAPDEIVAAARLAIDAGADFLKTSTGMGFPGATPATAESLARTIAAAGRPVGLKVSGGVRTTQDALRYLAIARETLGATRIEPSGFRIGASALLDDLIGHVTGG